MKREPEIVFQLIKKRILELLEVIKEKKWDVLLCPETTGKQSQFGDLDELLRLQKETGCSICVDFSHVYARSNGTILFDEICKKLKTLVYIHAHFSGIEFTEKGERKHIPVEDNFAQEFINAIRKYNLNVNVIIESPDSFKDAKSMKLMN